MSKVIALVFMTLFCIGVAVWPEVAMYFSWQLIAPQTETARILLIIAFWFGGAGLSIGFGALAIMLWAAMVTTL